MTLHYELFRAISLMIIVPVLIGRGRVVAVVDNNVAEEPHHESNDVNRSPWGIVILPQPTNDANTLVRRIDETLNLTCVIEHYDAGTRTAPKPIEHNYEELFKLSWLLPIMQQNSKNRVSFVESPNTLQLIMNHLKDTDTGEYVCQAKSLQDDNFSVAFTDSVRIRVKPHKTSCSEPSFLCSSGECIAKRFLCDGKDDCKDRSDESVQQCGTSHPCEGKLKCEDNRCIASHWCCDSNVDPNCSVRNIPSCCRQLFPIQVSLDVTQYSPQPQHYNDMGFLQTTIYTVIGCAMAFMFIITIMVIAICRVHLKRTAITRYPHHLSQSAQRQDSWGNIFLHPAASLPYTSAASGLLVTYNINNGVQFVGRPVNPPPYSEVVRLPPREGPPPPYASVENLASASAMSSSTNYSPQPHQNSSLELARNLRQIYILEDDPEGLATLQPLLINSGDINGNNTDGDQVVSNINPSSEIERDTSVQSLSSSLSSTESILPISTSTTTNAIDDS